MFVGKFIVLASIVLFITQVVLAAPAPTGPNADLNVKVQQIGGKFLITWDPAAPQIAGATEVVLLTQDGSKQPYTMVLTSDQLRDGSATYGAWPPHNNVEFRLVVGGQSSGKGFFRTTMSYGL